MISAGGGATWWRRDVSAQPPPSPFSMALPAASHARAQPAPAQSAELPRGSARPNRWFLATAILAQAVWIGFLAAMALRG